MSYFSILLWKKTCTHNIEALTSPLILQTPHDSPGLCRVFKHTDFESSKKPVTIYRILEDGEGRLSQRWTSKFNRRVNKIFSVLGFHCIFPLPKFILVQLKRIPVFKGIIHLDSSTWAVFGATANLVENHDFNLCKQNTAVAWQPDNYRVRTFPVHSSHPAS